MGIKLICGCGYVGRRVAQRWLEAGDVVFATTRSAERAAAFRRDQIHPLLLDIRQPVSFPADLAQLDTVLFAVGFDRSQHTSIHEVYVEGLRHVLQALPDRVGRFFYISSTGVYGQTEGEWVDEETTCHPHRAGGQACLDAERLLAVHPLASRSIVLRLAGIYGPGRIPKRETIQAGDPIDTVPDGYLNLIHVEDVVNVITTAERTVTPPSLYVVSDGHPVLRGEFYAELARQLSAPPPRFNPPADPAAAGRAGSDKRVRNDRLLREVQVSLRYPSYREGLAAILAASQ
jgi:nucleoside-diphosphate-sugar epimerase